jgi:hypothetical protein
LNSGRRVNSTVIPSPLLKTANGDDAYPGSLQEYVEAARQVLETNANAIGMKSLQLLEKSAFVTAAGLKGYKLTHTAVVKDIPIIFRQYVFERSNQKQLIFTCTSLTAIPEIGAVCDAAIKTVTLEPKRAEQIVGREARKPVSQLNHLIQSCRCRAPASTQPFDGI